MLLKDLKALYLREIATLEPFHLHLTGEVQEVKVFGDWGYCWNRLSVLMEPKDGGTPLKRFGDVLSVLQKQAGGWVIVRGANLLSAVLP